MPGEDDLVIKIGAILGGSYSKAFKKIKKDLDNVQGKATKGNRAYNPYAKIMADMGVKQTRQLMAVASKRLNMAKLMKDSVMSRALKKDGSLRKNIKGGRAAFEADLAKANANLARAKGRAASTYKNLSNALTQQARVTAGINAANQQYHAAIRQATQALRSQRQNRFNTITGNASKRQATAGQAMMVGGGILAGTGAVAYALAAPISAAARFEKSMATVRAVSEATKTEMKDMGLTARKLGRDSIFTADEVAEAMRHLAQTGFDPERIKASMGAVVNLAAAGGVEVEFMADKLAGVMTSFKMVGSTAAETAKLTQDAADVLAYTANKTNVDIPDLVETIKYAGLTAEAYQTKDAFLELSAAIGILGNAGLKGSMAGTALRAMLIKIAAPSKQAAKVITDIGLITKDANGDLLPMSVILGDLGEKLKRYGTGDQLAVVKKMFDIRAAGPAQRIAQAIVSGEFGEAMRGLKNDAKGYAKIVSDMRLDNIIDQLGILKDNLWDVALSIFQSVAPGLKVLIKSVTSVVQAFNAMLQMPFIGQLLSLAIGVGGIAAMVAAVTAGVGILMGGFLFGLNAFVAEMAALQRAGLFGMFLRSKGIGGTVGQVSAIGSALGILLTPVKSILGLAKGLGGGVIKYLGLILQALTANNIASLFKGGGLAALFTGKGIGSAIKSILGRVIGFITSGLFRIATLVLTAAFWEVALGLGILGGAVWGLSKLMGDNTKAVKDNTAIEKAKTASTYVDTKFTRPKSLNDLVPYYQDSGMSLSTDKLRMYEETVGAFTGTGSPTFNITIQANNSGLTAENSGDVASFIVKHIEESINGQKRRAARGAWI